MAAFVAARRLMIDGQLRINDVTNPRLIGAIQNIPRERFVPADLAELAYMDRDLEVQGAVAGAAPRYLIKPLVLAKLLEIADIGPQDRVLDIGCTTGYSSAVIAGLAREVVALESDAGLAETAAANVAALRIGNVTVRTGPLELGAQSDSPFDVIVIGGAVELVPEALAGQLSPQGRLVCVLREGPVGKGMIYRAGAGVLSGRSVFNAAAPLLPGFAKPRAFAF